MTPDYLIFDLDGTLLETRADIARAVNFALEAHGLPRLDPTVITGFVGDGVGRLVDRSLVAAGADPGLAPGVVQALLAFYLDHPVVDTRPYPGLEAALDALPAVPLAVVSNKPGEICRRILAHFGLLARFGAVLGGDWGGPRKPDPAPLREAAARLGRPGPGGVMIGDSEVDVRAGQAAGLLTVGALYGYRSREAVLAARPSAVIASIGELPRVLRALG